jgi:hypothetical protein
MCQFRTIQFEIVNPMLVDNNQSYPGTFPYDIVVEVYKFDPATKTYNLIWNQTDDTPAPLLALRSGDTVPYRFNFTIRDFENTTMTDLNKNDGI